VILIRSLVVLVVLGSAALAQAKTGKCPLPKVSYEAQMKVSSGAAAGQPAINMQAKVYVAGKQMRLEMTQGGMQMVVIADQKKKRALMLMPQMKKFFETPLRQEQLGTLSAASQCDLERIGSEKVAGLKATKYRLVAKDKHTTTRGTLWLTKDNIAVKLVGKAEQKRDGKAVSLPVSVALSKVKIGPIANKRFAVPKGYSKASMPGMPGMPPAGE
jgi:hypothetical protein